MRGNEKVKRKTKRSSKEGTNKRKKALIKHRALEIGGLILKTKKKRESEEREILHSS